MLSVPLDLFQAWLSNKNLKPRSIQNYLYYFQRFNYYRFNQESVSKFLSDKNNQNSIARSTLVNLKEFMIVNYLELKVDPIYYKEISDVVLPKLTGRLKQRLINPLSESEIKALENKLSTEQLKLMLLISFYGALRLQELIRIKVNSFNWEVWKIKSESMGEIRVLGKGDREGIALIPGQLMMRISKYINKQATEFKSIDSKLFNIGISSWQKYLHKAGIDSGISHKGSDGEILKETAVHPHRLRHSQGHNLMINNVDIRYIKEALRHKSISSTQIYTQLSTEELKEKLSIVNK